MRQFMMIVTTLAAFGAMVAAAQAETPSPGPVPSDLLDYSWAAGADYQKLFNAMVQQHRLRYLANSFDPLHILMLGLGRELPDRHVLDHAPTPRADGLLGYGAAPVLSEGC